VTQHFATAVPASIESAAKPWPHGENFNETLDSAPKCAGIDADGTGQICQSWHDTLTGMTPRRAELHTVYRNCCS